MKRLLAYSSIAHAGFILVGVLVHGAHRGERRLVLPRGIRTDDHRGIRDRRVWSARVALRRRHLSQWTGLGKRHPWTAGVFAFLLLAFAGIPLTSGFTAKFAVFKPALESGTAGAVLVVLGLLCSAITVFVYVRIIVLMYFTESTGRFRGGRRAVGLHHRDGRDGDVVHPRARRGTGLGPAARRAGIAVHPVTSVAAESRKSGR
jgi:NADH:ubiquinone oxidoreductase subunit 2 (subunit N)